MKHLNDDTPPAWLKNFCDLHALKIISDGDSWDFRRRSDNRLIGKRFKGHSRLRMVALIMEGLENNGYES